MSDAAAEYAALAHRFSAVVAAVPPETWGAASPCAGWSAADVLAHVVATQRDFLVGHDLDLGAPVDPAVAASDPAAAWDAHRRSVEALLAEPGVADHGFDGFFGPTTIGATLVRFYGFDLIVHRWDLARATGADPVLAELSAAELDQVEASIDGFGEHLYGEGICGPAVTVGADASRQDLLLARMGRDPGWQAP